jgi:hypothetical protein
VLDKGPDYPPVEEILTNPDEVAVSSPPFPDIDRFHSSTLIDSFLCNQLHKNWYVLYQAVYGFPNSRSLCSNDGNKLMFSSCFQHWNFIVSRVYAPLLIVEKMNNRE